MLRPMRRSRSAVHLSVCVVFGCGGQTGSTADQRTRLERSPNAGVDAGVPAQPAPALPMVPIPMPPRMIDPDVYDDPGCPAAPMATDFDNCDPLSEESGCAAGEACFPGVIYPDGPCGTERYGAWCAPAGVGVQGMPCAGGGCAAGHICVNTGEGTECVRLCGLAQAQGACPAGLLCLPIDIEGLGGCL